jgi:exopolysaccharide biosynthesis polyprenyl glycosylphosphotransferase
MASLKLTRPPLKPLDILLKRIIDISLSAFGLILLSPLFILIALLIKRDSPGPVFYRQKRHGFNHELFDIYKFRTMHVAENETRITQATRNDKRVTRIGRILRRFNIDELPQLLNVLKGEMSIVGPRPHALIHNREWEHKVRLYARRHNVKPGITGWAQINGWRGETDTDVKIRSRVQHDLHYIDNWTVWLDIYIILATLFSRKSYRNAY